MKTGKGKNSFAVAIFNYEWVRILSTLKGCFTSENINYIMFFYNIMFIFRPGNSDFTHWDLLLVSK